MKTLSFKVLAFLILPAILTPLLAQEQKVEIEKVSEKCDGVPFEDRIRIAVADFGVASLKVPRYEFGSELAVMLTNALQNINCFKVLEKMSVMQSSEVAKEGNLAKEGNIANTVATYDPKMLAAQAILTGDVTEFGSSSGHAQILGVGIKNPKVRFGFILKVINPVTREVMWSESIEVESKKGGAFSGVTFGGVIKIAGSDKYNKAEADALERGIIKAMYLLSEEMDEIPFPEVDNSTVTLIEVSEAGFMDLQNLMNAFKGDSNLKSVTRLSFSENRGTLQLKHDLTTEEVLNIIASKGASIADIIGFEGNTIQMKVKNN